MRQVRQGCWLLSVLLLMVGVTACATTPKPPTKTAEAWEAEKASGIRACQAQGRELYVDEQTRTVVGCYTRMEWEAKRAADAAERSANAMSALILLQALRAQQDTLQPRPLYREQCSGQAFGNQFGNQFYWSCR